MIYYDEYVPGQMRAQCTRVVDGDTVDLYVDCGFHCYRRDRFRLLDCDTYELHDPDPAKRQLALAAKAFTSMVLAPDSFQWTCRIVPLKDPDHFGRWLAVVYYREEDGAEVVLADQLRALGYATLYGGTK